MAVTFVDITESLQASAVGAAAAVNGNNSSPTHSITTAADLYVAKDLPVGAVE